MFVIKWSKCLAVVRCVLGGFGCFNGPTVQQYTHFSPRLHLLRKYLDFLELHRELGTSAMGCNFAVVPLVAIRANTVEKPQNM